MNTGRVLLIGGCPRAGKTTLSVRLAKEGGFSRISLDSISDALIQGFPEILIEDPTDQEECATKKFAFFQSFIGSLLNDAELYGINSVLDMYDFTPEHVHRLPFRDRLEVWFLGFPELSVSEIRRVIRQYAAPTDWIAQVDEDYLTVVAERIHRFNQKLKKQCQDYGYPFVDTGVGDARTQKLQELYEMIITCGASQ